jgi:hypothetical protein
MFSQKKVWDHISRYLQTATTQLVKKGPNIMKNNILLACIKLGSKVNQNHYFALYFVKQDNFPDFVSILQPMIV